MVSQLCVNTGRITGAVTRTNNSAVPQFPYESMKVAAVLRRYAGVCSIDTRIRTHTHLTHTHTHMHKDMFPH